MNAEIISIGTEILLGEITDTNSAFMAAQLPGLGIHLKWISTAGDDMNQLAEILGRAWQRSDVIFTSGGLGPTGDDLTREAIAALLKEEIHIDQSLAEALRNRFGRAITSPMPSSNLKQASIIPSASAIPNRNGTAPGWLVEKDGHFIVALPGPPAELQPMWHESVAPRLARLGDNIIISRTIKTAGLSESAVGEMVDEMFRCENPVLGVYAKADGIHLRFIATAKTKDEADALIAGGEAAVRKLLGDYIWGTDNDTLGGAVGKLLLENSKKLAIMEDYSGGLLTATISDVADSQSFFAGGIIAQNDKIKEAFGVEGNVLSTYGVASAEAAKAMAEAVRIFLKADIGLSCSAAAETAERPTGVIYLGIADTNGSYAIQRPRRKQYLPSAAFSEVRKRLLLPNGNG